VKSQLSNPASEYLFLDNDTEVTPRFLANLVQPLREHNSIAQTTAKILFMQRPDVINVAGGANIRFWRGTTRPIGYGEPDRGQYDQPFDCIAGTGCTLVRASAFHALN
jgi:GT2 family glycosyltransferase